MKYIAIEKELIPYRFNIELGGEMFNFEFHYNETYDFFTCNLSKNDEPILTGEKLIYNQALFTAFTHLAIPSITIKPFDRSDENKRITWDNFNDEVYLYVEA